MDINSIKNKIKEYIKSITPPGTQLMVDGSPILWLSDLQICCDGSVPIQCLSCCKTPGHYGNCYSPLKQCSFVREN